MRFFKNLAMTVGALCVFGACSTAFAQDNSFIQGDASITVDTENEIIKNESLEKTVKAKQTREDGWYPKLLVGGSAQLGYNKDVDGIDDGLTFTFGLLLNGGIDLVHTFGEAGMLEWQNKLSIEDQMTKTPTIDTFIKSKDKLDFETMLLYRIPDVEWLGPFARFQLTTSIFPGNYISDKAITVRYYKEDTKIDKKSDDKLLRKDELAAQESVKLASAGIPLTLKESVGLFMDPYQSTPFNMSFKVGLAGQELYADGKSYTSFDDTDDDVFYDVRFLGDGWTSSVGVEGSLDFKGVVIDIFNWEVYGRIYYPFEGNFDKDIYKGADRIHAEIMTKLSIKIASWASFDYSLDVKRDPFVTLDWQITNNLLLTLFFDVFKNAK